MFGILIIIEGLLMKLVRYLTKKRQNKIDDVSRKVADAFIKMYKK